jgi:hypothetical protein
MVQDCGAGLRRRIAPSPCVGAGPRDPQTEAFNDPDRGVGLTLTTPPGQRKCP